MLLQLSHTQTFHPAIGPRAAQVAAMFGLALDEPTRQTVLAPLTLRLRPGQLIFVTGPSGGGKSTLLRRIAERLGADPRASLIELERDPPDDRPIVDQLGPTLEEALRCLSLAGLGEASLMLRTPAQLSEGQRYRWMLARAISRCESPPPMPVLLADEFGSTLDRLTAALVARSIRKWVAGSGVCFVAASAHDDLLEHLQPDTLILQDESGTQQIER